MHSTVGSMTFETVNELDFVGPYEVFENSDYLLRTPIFPGVELGPNTVEVLLIGKERRLGDL